MFRWEWGVVRVALEMVPTSVAMLGSDTPQTLLSNREVIRPNNHFLVREADYRMWSRRCNVVWINEDRSFTGLKGGLRAGLGDGISHVIRLKPKAQMGLGITWSYNYLWMTNKKKKKSHDCHPNRTFILSQKKKKKKKKKTFVFKLHQILCNVILFEVEV